MQVGVRAVEHGEGGITRHGNEKHSSTTSSLPENPMKNFFIKVLPTIISIEMLTGKGNIGR